eukprot:6795116-Pyramimonas_sp.AAC.1
MDPCTITSTYMLRYCTLTASTQYHLVLRSVVHRGVYYHVLPALRCVRFRLASLTRPSDVRCGDKAHTLAGASFGEAQQWVEQLKVLVLYSLISLPLLLDHMCHTHRATILYNGVWCVILLHFTGSFYGSSCANNGKGALNTPETTRV